MAGPLEGIRVFDLTLMMVGPWSTQNLGQMGAEVFHVERGGLVELLRQIARAPQHRIALLADTPDLQASHEYLELIARQHGVRVRSFRGEAEALAWFKDRRMQAERRLGGERRRSDDLRPARERRVVGERRQGNRRTRSAT